MSDRSFGGNFNLEGAPKPPKSPLTPFHDSVVRGNSGTPEPFHTIGMRLPVIISPLLFCCVHSFHLELVGRDVTS